MANSQSHNPYVGPRPFEREERNLFFGREREISELQSLLTAHRTLLLYAASGAGKTSLLNAGLLPLMEQEGFEVFPVARVRGLIPEGVRPEDISNLYVFNTLMSWTEDEASYKTLPRMSLAEFLKTREHILDSEGFSAPRLIVFDQFEELFTVYQQHWKQRADFFHQVAEALDQDPLLRVLFVMREDYLASFDPHVSLLPERLRARYRLDRLGFEDACQAVEGPLKSSGRSFADGVAARLVGELLKTKDQSVTGETVEAVGEYAEPVQLQIVCRNLWDSLPADVTIITSGHLHAFADVDEALKGFYENAVQKTISETTATEEELRKWFARELITPAGTRGTAFRGKEDTAGISNAAVDILENEHIVRGEQRAGAHWYELTHDRLIEPIRNSNENWLPDFEVKQARLLARKKLRRFLFVSVPVVLALLTVATIFSFKKAKQAEVARVQEKQAHVEKEEAVVRAAKAADAARLALKSSEERSKLTKDDEKEIAQLTESLRGCDLTAEALKRAVFDPKGTNWVFSNRLEFNPENQITLEAWFKAKALGTRQAIIYKPYTSRRGGEPYYQYNLELRQTGQLYFALAINGVRRYIDGAFLVDPRKWYHVAATYDGTCMKLYLCGKEWGKEYPANGTLSIYDTPLDIGVGNKGSGNPDRPFNGLLAEVRIWKVARTADQIRAAMHKTIPANEEDLVWSSTNWLPIERAAFNLTKKKEVLSSLDEKGVNPKDRITLEAWFNTNSLNNHQWIIDKLPDEINKQPYYQYHLGLRPGGGLYFALAIDKKRAFIDKAFEGSVKKNIWHHVAATYDGTWMRLYLDGEELRKQPGFGGSLSIYNTELDIGAVKSVESCKVDALFQGQLAEVRIWEVARSKKEINDNMYKIISANEKGLLWSSTNWFLCIADVAFWSN